jgi:hypothetical protein
MMILERSEALSRLPASRISTPTMCLCSSTSTVRDGHGFRLEQAETELAEVDEVIE